MIIGHRDFDDFQDVFQCFDANTGESLWRVEYLAVAALDYGQSPRATPSIVKDRVILLGAMGHLHCVDIDDGTILWKHDLKSEFEVTAEMPWGFCGSPLIVDNKVIVQAGGSDSSLVAFDLQTGQLLWQTPGLAPSYGSLIVGEFGGLRQIVGHDVSTLGGWDVETGERLWTLTPRIEGDFNVPTPMAYEDQLLIVTENNGARLYRFRDEGRIEPEPVAVNRRLTPDMSSPVIVGQHVYCVDGVLVCLDLEDDLSEVYRHRDQVIGDYAAIIADDSRFLVVGNGELILFAAGGNEPIEISRQRYSNSDVDAFSHPALVGERLYIRDETTLYCLSLGSDENVR